MRIRSKKLSGLMMLAMAAVVMSAPIYAQPGCVSDPEGDATGDGPDVIELCAYTDGDQLTIEVTFADEIDPPGSGGTVDEVLGIVQFDVDQDPATGVPGLLELPAEHCDVDPSTFGTDAGLDIESYSSTTGTAPLLLLDDDGDVSSPGEADVQFGADYLIAQFDAAIIGSSDGIVNLSGFFGNSFEGDSFDCVPDSGFATSALLGDPPESVESVSVPIGGPVVVVLLAALMFGLAWMRLRV